MRRRHNAIRVVGGPAIGCRRAGGNGGRLLAFVALLLVVSLLPSSPSSWASSRHTWSVTGRMMTGRLGHTATLLPNGQVLVVGGSRCCTTGGGSIVLASAELYNPRTGRWAPTHPMHVARSAFTATLLRTGKVLVAGGEATSGYPPSTSELYDPRTGTWTMTGRMTVARCRESPLLLSHC
jgi:Galactose oxidase, central domain/Kelch motif